jgi:hypothetical protein
MGLMNLRSVPAVIRRSVEESPVFALMHERRRESAAPLRELFSENTKQVVLAALIFVGNSAAGYLLLAFFISYGLTTLHLPPGQLLAASTFASAAWLVFTVISERIYKRRAASEVKLLTAIERFVGDLLRVRTGMTAPANVYRAIGRSRFDDDKVKYDLFAQVLNGLKTLGLVFHLNSSLPRDSLRLPTSDGPGQKTVALIAKPDRA